MLALSDNKKQYKNLPEIFKERKDRKKRLTKRNICIAI
jgi:hypothetical protein